MPFIAIIRKSNSKIENIYKSEEPRQQDYFGIWGDPNLTVHVKVPPECNIYVIKAVLQEDGSYTFEKDEVKTPLVLANNRSAVISMRNQKLIASDWTQLVDVPLTTEKKQEWDNYRQVLRDFVATLSDDQILAIESIGWPDPPSSE